MGAIESKVVVEVEKVSSFVPRVDYVLEKPRVEPVWKWGGLQCVSTDFVVVREKGDLGIAPYIVNDNVYDALYKEAGPLIVEPPRFLRYSIWLEGNLGAIIYYYKNKAIRVIYEKVIFPRRRSESEIFQLGAPELAVVPYENVKLTKIAIKETIYDLIIKKEVLQKINLDRGYVASYDIFDKTEYPIICDYASKYLTRSDWAKLDALEKAKVYRFLGQLVLLDLYTSSNRLIWEGKEGLGLEHDVMLTRMFSDWCLSLMDNSIKKLLRNSNIRVIGETYAGYDTEYQCIDFGKNELLSAQVSISAGIKISVPERKRYVYQGVHTLTNEEYEKSPPKIPSFSELEKYIDERITENRLYSSGNKDKVLENVSKRLACCPDVESFRKVDGWNIFQFKKMPIINKFIKNAPNEVLEISFETLVSIIKNSVNMDLLISKCINRCLEGNATTLLPEYSGVPWDGKSDLNKEILEVILSNEENEAKKPAFKPQKPIMRRGVDFNVGEKVYLICHYNTADLSMLSNWDSHKIRNIDTIGKGYCSLIKGMEVLGLKVHIRDTVSLSSAAAGTLEAIGKSHGLEKVAIEDSYKVNMKKLLLDNEELFKEYAMQDSLITLIHGLFINDFAFRLGALDLPVTLGSLSNKYISNKWKSDGYNGYQIDVNYPLGNAQTSYTPRGITTLGKTGEVMNIFLGSFRGGRNECFSYGLDNEERWYDYDLTSCYSTIMSMCGDPGYAEGVKSGSSILPFVQEPDYSRAEYIDPRKVYKYDFKEGYSAVRVKFKLPDKVDYPGIPVNLDENITIYPKEGEGVITGLEYLAAKKVIEMYELQGLRRTEEIGELENAVDSSNGKIVSLGFELYSIWGALGEGSSSEGEFLPRTSGPSSLPPKSLPLGTPVPSGTRVPLGTIGKISSKEEISPEISENIFVEPMETMKEIPKGEAKGQVVPKGEPISKELEVSGLTRIRRVNAKDRRRVGEIPRSRSYLYVSRKLNNIPLLVRYDPMFTQRLNLSKVPNWKEDYSTTTSISRAPFLSVVYGFYIPFKKDSYLPFYQVINELQANRRMHPKKSAMERIFKDLGNMLYGKTVCGISNKRKFDTRLETMNAMKGNYLANPIIGAWITGFVRSLISELLNATNILGGKICAVTTDGFVTNIENLEEKVLSLFAKINYKNSFLQDYRNIRQKLSKDPSALEIKTSVRGLIQWTTRGQISCDPQNPFIAAMTGFQKNQFKHDKNVEMVTNSMNSNNKIFYLQKRLTGALENYKNNSQVSMLSHLSVFRTIFDSKRNLIPSKDSMLFSKPYSHINDALLARTMLNNFKSGIYSDTYTPKSTFVSSSSIIIETIKYFLRFMLSLNNWKPDLKIIDMTIKACEIYRYLGFRFTKNPSALVQKLTYAVLLNKGKIQSQLSSYATNRVFVKLLFLLLPFNSNYIELYKAFSSVYWQDTTSIVDILTEKYNTIVHNIVQSIESF